ncbi:MAG TPA: DinB family protein [Spirochaetia bacterium]|nr:DinB family protein [Spirochaetia bacterium]
MDEGKLREQLAVSLGGRGAHVPFDKAVEGFPLELAGRRVSGLPHTAWQLLYHLWICQWDILEFVRDPSHESPAWPEGTWPKEDAPAQAAEWQTTVRKFRSDNKAVIGLVRDGKNDLTEPIPHGQGQTLVREALLVIDHNSYHIGQLVFVRRALKAWPD